MNYKKTMLAMMKDPLVLIPTIQMVVGLSAIAMNPARRNLNVLTFVVGAILLPAFLFIGLRKLLTHLNHKVISNKTIKSMVAFAIKYLLPVLFIICAYFASMLAFVGFVFGGPY